MFFLGKGCGGPSMCVLHLCWIHKGRGGWHCGRKGCKYSRHGEGNATVDLQPRLKIRKDASDTSSTVMRNFRLIYYKVSVWVYAVTDQPPRLPLPDSALASPPPPDHVKAGRCSCCTAWFSTSAPRIQMDETCLHHVCPISH